MDKYYYSYSEFISDIKKLSTQIKKENFDTIVAIARGGLTIGHFLANSINLRRVFAINSIHYNNTNKLDTLDIFNIPNLSSSKKVLIVDDIADSGETLSAVLNLLKEKYPNCSYKSSAIFYKDSSIIKPDFTIKHTNKWIEFFWEVDTIV